MQNLKTKRVKRMSIANPNQADSISKPLLIPYHRATADDLLVPAATPSKPGVPNPKRKLPVKKFSAAAVKYKECLKNHAAAIGGSATDGCGEFMAGGEEGSLEALKCSACNCHRNFHRKIYMQEPPRGPNGCGVLRIKTVGTATAEGKKRFRTKFDQEQKEKMLVFAEKAGWKLQKADDAEVRSLCEEIGVKRKVLKVWMHNNKYHFGNKTNSPSLD